MWLWNVQHKEIFFISCTIIPSFYVILICNCSANKRIWIAANPFKHKLSPFWSREWSDPISWRQPSLKLNSDSNACILQRCTSLHMPEFFSASLLFWVKHRVDKWCSKAERQMLFEKLSLGAVFPRLSCWRALQWGDKCLQLHRLPRRKQHLVVRCPAMHVGKISQFFDQRHKQNVGASWHQVEGLSKQMKLEKQMSRWPGMKREQVLPRKVCVSGSPPQWHAHIQLYVSARVCAADNRASCSLTKPLDCKGCVQLPLASTFNTWEHRYCFQCL